MRQTTVWRKSVTLQEEAHSRGRLRRLPTLYLLSLNARRRWCNIRAGNSLALICMACLPPSSGLFFDLETAYIGSANLTAACVATLRRVFSPTTPRLCSPPLNSSTRFGWARTAKIAAVRNSAATGLSRKICKMSSFDIELNVYLKYEKKLEINLLFLIKARYIK